MQNIYACIDGRAGSHAVVEGAIWAVQLLCAPLRFLHVLERHPEQADHADYSGAIGVDANDDLLRELTEVDHRRGQLMQEAGRRMLAMAEAKTRRAGIAPQDSLLRHGTLAETAADLESSARLFVLGHRREHDERTPINHHVEGLIRSVKAPILVVPSSVFQAPQQVVIAFDGSAHGMNVVDRLATSPLMAGLPVLLATAGPRASTEAATSIAMRTLQDRGFRVTAQSLDGEPATAISGFPNRAGALLVIGAYGHSRIRQRIVGSTTTALLRRSAVPMLVMR